MKSSVLQRKLFMKPPVKKAEGGILSLVEDGEEEEPDNYQDRTPDNIEIVANNLRGDMRSMEERYMELAQMVGESAFETPPEVLALMQPQLAQQMQQAQQPAAPTARPSGMEQIAAAAPPGAPPGPQAQPGMPQMPPEQAEQPGGIESLVAEAPQEQPQQPVQRSEGSPPTAEVSRSRIEEYIPETELMSYGDMGADDDIDAALQNYFSSGGNMSELADVAMGQGPMRINIEGVGPFGSNEDEGVPTVTDVNFDKNLPFKQKDSGGIGSLMPKRKSGGFSPDVSKFMGKDPRESMAEDAAAYGAMMRFASPVKRQAGSPPMGERIPPYLSDVARNIPIVDPRDPRGMGLMYPQDDRFYSGEGMKMSRPLSADEIAERVAEREARTMTRGQRALKGISNFFGQNLRIDPEVAETRIRNFLQGASKIPGVGKVAKYADILLPAGALAIGAASMDDPKPALKDGVVPPMPGREDSVANLIPPAAGEPPLETRDQGPPMDTDITPRQELTRIEDDAPVVKEVDLVTPTDEDFPNPFTGANVPPGDQGEDVSMGLGLAKQAGESEKDFRTRVTERANLYKELLGTNPNDQKTQAYLLLAEAGLALAGATGRNQGERISKGLRGLPSGLAKIAAERTQLDRAATSAAISAVEQEDRDRMKYAYDLRKKQADLLKANLPRTQKIQFQANLRKSMNPSLTDEQAEMLGVGLVDGHFAEDEFGNLRSKDGQILDRGPGMMATTPGQVGYIADDNPFLVKGKNTLPAAITKDEITRVRKDRGDSAKLLASIQTAMPLIEKTFGIGNVLTRAVTSAVTPFVGDVGPFSADKLQGERAIVMLRKEITRLLAMNPERASVYEQQLINTLTTPPSKLLTTPEIVVGELQNFSTMLTNEINAFDSQLNPNTEFKQLKVPPLGTKNDPIPPNAVKMLGEFFESRPSGIIYVQRQDPRTGQTSVIGLTREDWQRGQGTQ
jgi:hypothetical protein